MDDTSTDVRVTRLPDPDPESPGRSAVSKWWPPVMLQPDWARDNDDFDIFHLQFGFDARTPAQLQELVEVLPRRRKPFVFTVHDLRNPHHETRELHDAQLDVLIPAADALVTLTSGAAQEIERRWGRTAQVIPHPHVVDFDTMARVQAARASASTDRDGAFRVGVHIKSLRASMNPGPVVTTLIETVRRLPGAVLQVNGHTDVLTPTGARYDAELAGLLNAAHEAGDIELHVHDFFSDAELWAYLASLDVSVLPYRFGTHSGWLEACHDLGTRVVAPSCGYYREQGPVLEYAHDDAGFDAATLTAAIECAWQDRSRSMASVEERRRQRAQVVAAHERLYLELLS